MRRTLLATTILAVASAGTAQVAWDVQADTWAATDHLGRPVAQSPDVPAPRDGKLVGIFYFLWQGAHTTSGPHNIMEITAGNPAEPAWGPLNHFHHWGEPLWGYYIGTDPYVHRRNIMMLSDAGVDFVCMDASNGPSYLDQLNAFLDEAAALKAQGHHVPRVTFLAHPSAVTSLHENLFRGGRESWNGENQAAGYTVDNGVLSFTSTGNDPYLISGAEWTFDATQYTRFVVRMKNGTGSTAARLYWGRVGARNFAQARSAPFTIVASDGDFTTYQLDLSTHPEWTGTIVDLRLDPAEGASALGPIDIEWIQLAGGPGVLRIWEFAGDHHPDLWMYRDGRPVMMPIGYRADEMPAVTDSFFTRRDSWAWTGSSGWFGTGENKWPWLDNHPQKFGWEDGDPATPVYVSIAVAQHPTSNIGRSYHGGSQPPPAQRDPANMACLREQFSRAISVDPEIIFVAGWNEWVAQRFVTENARQFIGQTLPAGGSYFVDAYNEEYNRDIEPMRGTYQDASYYLLVDQVRRFRGARPAPAATLAHAIAIDGNFADWDDVEPEHRDWRGDSTQRDHPGWGAAGRLTNTTWRNDIVRAKVAVSTSHVSFFVETAADITSHLGGDWMRLLIDSDNDASTGWEGFDVTLNRVGVTLGQTTVERWQDGAWVAAGTLPQRRVGPRMEVSVPRSMLGDPPDPVTLRYKWADNCLASGDAIGFTTDGDAAPSGRFTYSFRGPEPSVINAWRVTGP